MELLLSSERIYYLPFHAFLGGQVGAGTFVVALLVGPLLQALAQAIADFRHGRAARLQSVNPDLLEQEEQAA